MAATLMGMRGREGGLAPQKEKEAAAAVGKENGAGLLPKVPCSCQNCRPVGMFVVTKDVANCGPGFPYDRLGATATLVGLWGVGGRIAFQEEAPRPAAVGEGKGAVFLLEVHHCCQNCRPVATFVVTQECYQMYVDQGVYMTGWG